MRLSYNYDNDRYGVLNNMDLWEDKGLHCGEHLEVFIDGKWVEDRIEMSKGEYYLVESGLSGSQLEGLKVRLK